MYFCYINPLQKLPTSTCLDFGLPKNVAPEIAKISDTIFVYKYCLLPRFGLPSGFNYKYE